MNYISSRYYAILRRIGRWAEGRFLADRVRWEAWDRSGRLRRRWNGRHLTEEDARRYRRRLYRAKSIERFYAEKFRY